VTSVVATTSAARLAASRTSSSARWQKALSVPSNCSMRSRYRSATSTGLISFRRMAAAISTAGVKASMARSMHLSRLERSAATPEAGSPMADTPPPAAPAGVTGPRPSKRLRADGRVPATVYGLGSEAVSVSVDWRELRGALTTDAGLNALINLEVDGHASEL